MRQFELTPEEQQQADDSPIRFRNDPPFDTFSLREDTRWAFPVGNSEFSHHAAFWEPAHLVALRVKPLAELPLDRVLPRRFLPSPNDPQLVTCVEEIEKAFSTDSGDSSAFASLLGAIRASYGGEARHTTAREMEKFGTEVMREFLAASLLVAAAQVGSALRPGWHLVAQSDPSLRLEWRMGGCDLGFIGRINAFLSLKDREGDDGGSPVIVATRPWEHIASRLGHALGAAAANVAGEYRDQEAFVLDFEAPAQLSFASVFFTEEYLRKVLDDDPPAALPATYLRCSSFSDLSTPEGLKEAMRGMLGLLRYLLSGEAEVARMGMGLKK